MFPLPVEGFETRVIADDDQVINYMIELSEALDESRTERLMGWYHSHPFDVDETHNHCYLSNTGAHGGGGGDGGGGLCVTAVRWWGGTRPRGEGARTRPARVRWSCRQGRSCVVDPPTAR